MQNSANFTASQANLSNNAWGGLLSGSQQQSAGQANLGQSYSFQWPYYWYYPYHPAPQPRVTAVEVQTLIDVYKKNFGKDWKRAWAQTVRFEVS